MKPAKLLFALLCGVSIVAAADISGSWVANSENATGKIEVSYQLKVDANGKITGTQRLPLGESLIVDGRINGNEFEMSVLLDFFGNPSTGTAKGTVAGDTLLITPAMPVPRSGSTRRPPGGMMISGPLTFHRGTPTPTYRAPPVDYSKLPKVELPARRDLEANGLAPTPPMGWNSWNKFRTQISDQTVRGIADAMASSGMKAAGYQYVNIDDGWEWKRDESGTLLTNPNFPDMKALADYVHSKGLKLGIYSSPGPRTCGGYEGSYGHEEQDARMWAQWGIDYLKYDWCSAGRIWKDEDMPAAYQTMGEALKKTGRPIVYSLCQYGRYNVREWGPTVAGNLWRATGDIRDEWESMTTIGFSLSDWAPFAGPGHWYDPDMLEVGNGKMTAIEYRTHFSLWAMLAAPLIAGNDLRSMNAETGEILLNQEVIAVDQDKLGKAAQRVTKEGESEVWARPLADGSHAVALFNRGATEARVEAKWADLKLSGELRVRDLWAHKDLGVQSSAFGATVPAHGVVMVRVGR